jgi:MarR family 2-MHQ and catechol resistance regulon transcriptional repressor
MDIKLFDKFSRSILHSFKPEVGIDLKPKEFHLITMLMQKPDRPLHEYAHHIGLEKGSFTYLIQILELKGLLIRKDDFADKRRKTLILTEQGQALAKTLDEQLNNHIDHTLSGLSDSDQEKLKEAFETIKSILPKLPKPKRMHPHPEKH